MLFLLMQIIPFKSRRRSSLRSPTMSSNASGLPSPSPLLLYQQQAVNQLHKRFNDLAKRNPKAAEIVLRIEDWVLRYHGG